MGLSEPIDTVCTYVRMSLHVPPCRPFKIPEARESVLAMGFQMSVAWDFNIYSVSRGDLGKAKAGQGWGPLFPAPGGNPQQGKKKARRLEQERKRCGSARGTYLSHSMYHKEPCNLFGGCVWVPCPPSSSQMLLQVPHQSSSIYTWAANMVQSSGVYVMALSLSLSRFRILRARLRWVAFSYSGKDGEVAARSLPTYSK